jgi:hypothetical protein
MTTVATINDVKELNFAGPHIGARFVQNPRDFYVGPRTVVVNPCRSDAVVGVARTNVIPAFSSVILKDVMIGRADAVVLLELQDLSNLGSIVFEPSWSLYSALIPAATARPGATGPLPFPKNTPLWRSPQDDIGTMVFDPGTLPGQLNRHIGNVQFLVKVNFWFAPAGTDCFIHNRHDFIEIHSQITGFGRMQKFNAQDHAALYHDEMMSPGYTTVAPFCDVQGPSTFVYPWHQYYADTDCIWMAVEYHPTARKGIS